jgi:hypothetical protein
MRIWRPTSLMRALPAWLCQPTVGDSRGQRMGANVAKRCTGGTMLRAEVHDDPRHRRKGDDPTAADAESQRASLLRARSDRRAEARPRGARCAPFIDIS